jgi:lipopolysaccharide transport system ATP-binding protein
MSTPAIIVENLGKKYQIGLARNRKSTFGEALAHGLAEPFRRLRRLGQRSNGDDIFWALKGVSFEIQPGEVVGVIGRNGAGKSTLLKILSRITEPTEGRAVISGRVGSLLEVGTGFHPELTGRENIYLNGAILGMKKAEIARQFDQIVGFAEIGPFLETPVKHYSSGMYVRLAFAVAAHLNPEILLVDEVLAVGDSEFQKKCLGKMGEVARGGRTVLFVSHNMGAVARLCGRCIWVDGGHIRSQGPAAEVISAYLSRGLVSQAERRWADGEAPGGDAVRLRAVRIRQDGRTTSDVHIAKPFAIEADVDFPAPLRESAFSLRLIRSDGEVAFHSSDALGTGSLSRQSGPMTVACELPAHALNAGTYSVSVAADVPFVKVLFIAEDVLSLRVEWAGADNSRYNGAWQGILGPKLASWSARQAPLAPGGLAST